MRFKKVCEVREKSANENTLKALLMAVVLGSVLGLVSKILDGASFNPVFSDITSRLGIWVFVATLLSVYSYSPKTASIKVFAFFISLLVVYYTYSNIILNIFPRNIIIFWSICAIVSPFCAYIMWYAYGEKWYSNVLLSLPVTILMTEGWGLRNAYLPVHRHYYLVPILICIYILMVATLLYLIPEGSKQRISVILISILLSWILLHFNVLGLIFGGMNTML